MGRYLRLSLSPHLINLLSLVAGASLPAGYTSHVYAAALEEQGRDKSEPAGTERPRQQGEEEAEEDGIEGRERDGELAELPVGGLHAQVLVV